MDWTAFPVFVVGLQKSGTTLLVNLVDGCADAVVVPEETQLFRRKFMEPFFENFAGVSAQERADSAEALAQLIMERTPLRRFVHSEQKETVDGLIDYRNLDAAKFQTRLALNLRQEAAFSVRTVFISLARTLYEVAPSYEWRPEPKCWFEKTPSNLAYVEQLMKTFPNARFIQLIRDPRDNWISLKRKWKNRPLPLVARYWLRASRAAQSNTRKLGTDRYLVVRYEDLVRDPANVMHRICEFADLTFSSRLLNPTKAGATWLGNSMFEIRDRGIHKQSLGRFRDPRHSSDNARVEAIIGQRHMARWRYVPTTSPKTVARIQGAYLRARYYAGDRRRKIGDSAWLREI